MHSASMGLSSTSLPPYQISSTPSTSLFVPAVLSSYWYVFLVLLLVVAVATLFLCTCIIRRKRRHGQQPAMASTPQFHLQRISPASVRKTSIQHANSSALGGHGNPGNLSTGRTPIPSPQPSFSSSHRSLQSGGRYSSGMVGGHKRRRRHHSPGHTSSGSEDTIKAFPYHSSSSLTSSVVTLEPHCSRLHQAESISSGHSSRTHQSGCGSQSIGHRRSASNPNVKITALMQEFPLYSVPSSLSIISGRSHSTLPGPATACIPEKAKMMPVRMDVNVHLEQGQGVAPCQIAAALAESARQLAQSAANFEQEEGDVESMWSHSNISSQRPSHSVIFSHSSRQAGSRRQLFPNYFSAKLRDSAASSLSLDKPVSNYRIEPSWRLLGRDYD